MPPDPVMLQTPQRALRLSPGPPTRLQNEGHSLASTFTPLRGPKGLATTGGREGLSPGGTGPQRGATPTQLQTWLSAETGDIVKGEWKAGDAE